MTDGEQVQTRVSSVLEDPSAKAVARVYARSFLDAAGVASVPTSLEEFASFVDDVLATNPQFATLLQLQIVTRDEKIGIIDRVVAPLGSDLFANFLRVLARHDRLELLPLILDEANREHETRTGKKRVQVRSATPVSTKALDAIRQRLVAVFPFEPIIESETDSSLLGGLVIQVGNTVYDSSLRTRLKQLRGRLRERSRYEIQSGRDRFSHPEGD
jgi:F-type H+-transporting ATPase subunit delta